MDSDQCARTLKFHEFIKEELGGRISVLDLFTLDRLRKRFRMEHDSDYETDYEDLGTFDDWAAFILGDKHVYPHEVYKTLFSIYNKRRGEPEDGRVADSHPQTRTLVSNSRATSKEPNMGERGNSPEATAREAIGRGRSVLSNGRLGYTGSNRPGNARRPLGQKRPLGPTHLPGAILQKAQEQQREVRTVDFLLPERDGPRENKQVGPRSGGQLLRSKRVGEHAEACTPSEVGLRKRLSGLVQNLEDGPQIRSIPERQALATLAGWKATSGQYQTPGTPEVDTTQELDIDDYPE